MFRQIPYKNPLTLAFLACLRGCMNIIDHAEILWAKLSAKEIAYASDEARGEYRGFAALHDLMDANMLLPGADNFRGSSEELARMNAVMDKISEWMIEGKY